MRAYSASMTTFVRATNQFLTFLKEKTTCFCRQNENSTRNDAQVFLNLSNDYDLLQLVEIKLGFSSSYRDLSILKLISHINTDLMQNVALSDSAIFLATCNAVLLLRYVNQ